MLFNYCVLLVKCWTDANDCYYRYEKRVQFLLAKVGYVTLIGSSWPVHEVLDLKSYGDSEDVAVIADDPIDLGVS